MAKQRRRRLDQLEAVAQRKSAVLDVTKPSRQCRVSAKGRELLPSRVAFGMLGEQSQRMQDAAPHIGGPAEIGAVFRITRDMLVPQMQFADQLPCTDPGAIRH